MTHAPQTHAIYSLLFSIAGTESIPLLVGFFVPKGTINLVVLCFGNDMINKKNSKITDEKLRSYYELKFPIR